MYVFVVLLVVLLKKVNNLTNWAEKDALDDSCSGHVVLLKLLTKGVLTILNIFSRKKT